MVAMFDDEVILRTDVGPLLFENQYIQISTLLPEGYDFYGFGEADKARVRNLSGVPMDNSFRLDRIHPDRFLTMDKATFKRDIISRSRQTIWSAGQPVKPDANLYGTVHSSKV